MTKRVLFVSYAFPPVGGVGVHRVTKFVKYLPEHGWTSSVLTVSNPSVPLLDESLCRDIPPGTIVRKAKTLEPGYAFKNVVSAGRRGDGAAGGIATKLKGMLRGVGNLVLQPDPQILWRRHALREGTKLLREVPHDVIVATGPPFSSLLLGATLAQRTNLPLMLDYRDEWGISNAYWENKGQGRLVNAVQQRMQYAAVRVARVLLATTPSSAAALAAVARNAGSDVLATHIYNGFDSDDFSAAAPRRTRCDYGNGIGRFRLSFIGTLWNLNTIEPLVRGVERLCARRPQLAEELELVCAGRRTGDQEAILDRLQKLPCRVVRLPFIDHREAVAMMQEADALLLLNADLPHTERIINAKTFEYMAARRPMFVVAPPGDLWDVVRDLPGTVLCSPREPDRIAESLAVEIERRRCGLTHDDALWNISRFERRRLAGELADLLEKTRNTDEHRTSRRAASSLPNGVCNKERRD